MFVHLHEQSIYPDPIYIFLHNVKYIYHRNLPSLMARLNIDIPDKVMIPFRKKVLAKTGNLRGNVAPAVIEALNMWVGKED